MIKEAPTLYAGLIRICTFAVALGSGIECLKEDQSQPIASGIFALASAVAFGVLVLDSKAT
jgi:hypothetical protein